MNQGDNEGVIRFRVHLNRTPLHEEPEIRQLIVWRDILYRLDLVGQDSLRYSGLGFGNLSVRSLRKPDAFVVTGSQTGGIERLSEMHFCRVTSWKFESPEVWAEGLTSPSSESLTHAAIYESEKRVGAVIHVHCPEIWHQADTIGLAVSDPAAGCGSSALALEMRSMMATLKPADGGIWILGGHEDGVIAFGTDLMQTGLLVMQWFAAAKTRSADVVRQSPSKRL